jgi:hypothetical protein
VSDEVVRTDDNSQGVAAKAGTDNPSVRTTWFARDDERQWLWVPAFAGTTNC